MADDDWDEEELLMVTGRSTKAGKKRSRKAEESDDDDEQPARAQKAAGGKRQRAAPAPAAADSDDEDEDGMDAEERRKLDAMNELEREMYLFEREEKLQRERERKQVLSQARRDDQQVEVRASSRRPRTQTGTDSAIGRIAAAHAQREAREKKKQQEEEERQEKQQRARPSRKQQEEDEEEEPVEEEEEAASDDEEDEEMQEADDDEDEEEAELAALDEDEDELLLAGDKQQQLARAEEYDEGAGYEESEEHASLEEVRSIQLRRSNLEAWHNEPFFEDDVRGCVLRLSVPPTPEQQRAGQTQQTYMLVRVVDVVARNSYPFGKPGARTRKWLHLDDLSGNPVFRYQMAMVSNQEIKQSEYQRSLDRSKRSNGKFITKGDIHAAKQHLEHARTFKYNPELVKKLLEKKRAAGKMTGSAAQVRARLRHEINLARQEGKSEDDVLRLQDELDRLEQQEQRRQQEVDEIMAAASAKDKESAAAAAAAAASQSGTKLSADMALALINMRNRDKNNYKILGAAAAGKKQPATAEVNSTDVFSRRHTQSKVYWATKGNKKDAEVAEQQQQQQQASSLLRQGSGATDVTLLKQNLRKLEPADLIKVLELDVDLSRLPQNESGALLSRRLLGPRWFQSVERRQQDMAGRSLLTLDDWKRKMSYI